MSRNSQENNLFDKSLSKFLAFTKHTIIGQGACYTSRYIPDGIHECTTASFHCHTSSLFCPKSYTAIPFVCGLDSSYNVLLAVRSTIMPITPLNTTVDLDTVIASNGERYVVFFWAAWHEPSKIGGQMQGIYAALSEKYPSVKFCTVEAEEAPELSEHFEVSVVPTFVALSGKTVVGKVEGVNPAEVSALVKNLVDLRVEDLVNATPAEDKTSKLVKLINLAPVMLFMKGSPGTPKCGFSRQIVEILQKNGILFATFDILTDEEVRAGLKTFSDWPTYPQLYVKGALVGGLDIVKEMQEGGNLKQELGVEDLGLPPAPQALEDRLRALIGQNDVVLFMKGTPSEPRCGFSKTIVSILAEEDIAFSHFDILTDEEVRAGLKTFSDWPTYPQLYVKGALVGGLDIVKEMQEGGNLKQELGV